VSDGTLVFNAMATSSPMKKAVWSEERRTVGRLASRSVGHVPQDATVRLAPQVSVPVAGPQATPSLTQNWAFVSSAQPQTLGTTAPQVLGGVHGVPNPQSTTVRFTPQESSPVNVPHVAPSRAQNAASVSVVHPQTLGVPAPPQMVGGVHGVPKPQSATVRLTPQLSADVKLSQFLPSRAQNVASVSGVHALVNVALQSRKFQTLTFASAMNLRTCWPAVRKTPVLLTFWKTAVPPVTGTSSGPVRGMLFSSSMCIEAGLPPALATSKESVYVPVEATFTVYFSHSPGWM
jgi:hypothetical protein